MSLNTRLLFALLGFPLLVYAMMAFLFVFHADATGRAVLEERLVSTAELLAPSLGEAMADGDSQRLESLAGKLLEQRHLRAVTLFDEQGNRLLVMGTSLPPPARLHAPETTAIAMEDDLWRVQVPLTSESLSGRGRTNNGWLEAEMDIRTLVLERYKLIASLSLGGMLLGLSRKRFIGAIGGTDAAVPPDARDPGTLALTLAAVAQGIQIHRVHDVAGARQGLALWRAIFDEDTRAER